MKKSNSTALEYPDDDDDITRHTNSRFVSPIKTILSPRSVPKECNDALFKRWIYCVCIINFDLDIGQVLEYTFPKTEFKDDDVKRMYQHSFKC